MRKHASKEFIVVYFEVIHSIKVDPKDGLSDHYLSNFCKYQKKVKKLHKLEWDSAILLTGYELLVIYIFRIKYRSIYDSFLNSFKFLTYLQFIC